MSMFRRLALGKAKANGKEQGEGKAKGHGKTEKQREKELVSYSHIWTPPLQRCLSVGAQPWESRKGNGKGNSVSGVKAQKIRKGRIVVGFRDIWIVCLEIIALHKSKEKRRKT